MPFSGCSALHGVNPKLKKRESNGSCKQILTRFWLLTAQMFQKSFVNNKKLLRNIFLIMFDL